jgi:hypothetical protein
MIRSQEVICCVQANALTQLLRFITWSNTWLTPWSEFEISQSMQVMWPSTHVPARWEEFS